LSHGEIKQVPNCLHLSSYAGQGLVAFMLNTGKEKRHAIFFFSTPGNFVKYLNLPHILYKNFDKINTTMNLEGNLQGS
jgi:hypothetical protein